MINCKWGVTARVNNAMADSESMSKAVYSAMRQFVNFDFGKVPKEDTDQNIEDWITRDGRLLGRYKSPEGDIYIVMNFGEIPEEDQAVILFCEEY